MKITKHLPSHMNIAGHRMLASYDGQSVACYGCGDTGQACPKSRGGRTEISDPPSGAWAHVTATDAHNRSGTEESRKEVIHQRVSADQALGSPPFKWRPDEQIRPSRIIVEQSYPTQPRRNVLTPQEEVTHPDDGTPRIFPSHAVVVDADMIAPTTIQPDRMRNHCTRTSGENKAADKKRRQTSEIQTGW